MELKINNSIVEYSIENGANHTSASIAQEIYKDTGVSHVILLLKIMVGNGDIKAVIVKEFSSKFKDYPIIWVLGNADLSGSDAVKYRCVEEMYAEILGFRRLEFCYPEESVSYAVSSNTAGSSLFEKIRAADFVNCLYGFLDDESTRKVFIERIAEWNGLKEKLIRTLNDNQNI